jgi:polyphosphate kinase 2 (PPK2 family)
MQLVAGAANGIEVTLFNRSFYPRFLVYFSVGFMFPHNSSPFYKYNKMSEKW